MNEEEIKDYILKYKGTYSKEQIKEELSKYGVSSLEVDLIYNSKSKNVESRAGLALTLSIVGWFIPIIGIILVTIAIFLAHKARKINKNNNLALAALIIGYIYMSFIVFAFIIFIIFYSQLLFLSLGSNTLNSEVILPNKIDLNNNLRALTTDSVAYSSSGNLNENNNIAIVFIYVGAKRVEINSTGGLIFSSMLEPNKCKSTLIKNVDTDISNNNGSSVLFLNGQTGYLQFNCGGLISKEILEGELEIDVNNNNEIIKSSGSLRLMIN